MRAYKVFSPDWTCRGFKYQVGETYEEDINPSVCDRGFHFCKKLADCFNYYNFDSDNKVAEIEALGDIADGDDKCCTNKIKIVKEITWHEVLDMVNAGKGNTGFGNSGDRNSGDWNTGNWNSGNWNTGLYNSGDCNSGDCNAGDWNVGNRNTGHFNMSDNNAGCFNVDDHKLMFFDQETDLTWYRWRNSLAYALLRTIDSRKTKWVYADDMTYQEKLDHPSYETTDGYLKKRDSGKVHQEWWDQLNGDQKQCIKEIPNFDAEKFGMITGINTGINTEDIDVSDSGHVRKKNKKKKKHIGAKELQGI